MNSDPIPACLGRSEADPEGRRLLADLGVKKKLQMPRDDIEARVNLPKQGLSLVFQPSGPLTVEYAREDGRIAAVTVDVPAPG